MLLRRMLPSNDSGKSIGASGRTCTTSDASRTTAGDSLLSLPGAVTVRRKGRTAPLLTFAVTKERIPSMKTRVSHPQFGSLYLYGYDSDEKPVWASIREVKVSDVQNVLCRNSDTRESARIDYTESSLAPR